MRFQNTASSVKRLRVERRLTMVHKYHDRQTIIRLTKIEIGCEDNLRRLNSKTKTEFFLQDNLFVFALTFIDIRFWNSNQPSAIEWKSFLRNVNFITESIYIIPFLSLTICIDKWKCFERITYDFVNELNVKLNFIQCLPHICLQPHFQSHVQIHCSATAADSWISFFAI